jgi:hypothetical protein
VIPTRGRRPTTVKGWRKRLVDATLEECEAVGRCECGQELEGHEPLAKPRPLSAKSQRMSDVPFGRVSGQRWTEAQIAAHQNWSELRAGRAAGWVGKDRAAV